MQIVKKLKQDKESIVLLLKTQGIKNILMFWLIKKIMRHKIKRTQRKLIKIGTCDVCKISLSFLMIKGTYQIMVLIAWLIFIKIREVNKIGQS